MNTRDILRSVRSNAGRVERWVYVSGLLVWGMVPPLVMAILLITPRTLVGSPFLWIIPAVLWAFASLVVFSLMILKSLRKDLGSTSHFLQSLLSLTCTFSLGLPAILLSSLPLFGHPSDFLESLDPNGTDLDLPALLPATATDSEAEANTMYIIGIDVSSSFVKDGADLRLEKIYRTLDSLFSDTTESSFVDSLRPQDIIVYYGFAGEVDVLHSNEKDGKGLEGKRLKPPSADLPPIISNYIPSLAGQSTPRNLNRGDTDIIGFLEKVSADINDNFTNYSRVRVLLFSDLHYYVKASGNGATTLSEDQRLASFEKLRARLGQAQGSIIALSLDPHPDPHPGVYVGNEISSVLKSAWSEVDLDQYDGAKPQEKALLCENLYGRVSNPGILYLKYLSQPWKPLISSIHLPVSAEDDRLFIGLRSLDASANDIKIEVGVGGHGEFWLNGEGGKNSFKFLSRESSEQNPLQLQIGEEPTSPREVRGNLLIAVPKKSTLYKIPIAVLPVAKASTINSVKIVFGILHLFPMLLAIAIIWKSRRGNEAGVHAEASLISPSDHLRLQVSKQQ